MNAARVLRWLVQNSRRRLVLLSVTQPLTAKQAAFRTALDPDRCGYIIWELALNDLLRCLNQQARRSRVYWLTQGGSACQRRLCRMSQQPEAAHDCPEVDWELYGWVCFNHRAAVIKALTEPLQPAAIKRRARSQNPGLKMSANNVRDIIRLFNAKGIVQPVRLRKKAHLRYELTPMGKTFQRLLGQAEVRQ